MERSISPQMMTKVIPNAITPLRDAVRRTLRRLPEVRKEGERKVATINTTTRIISSLKRSAAEATFKSGDAGAFVLVIIFTSLIILGRNVDLVFFSRAVAHTESIKLVGGNLIGIDLADYFSFAHNQYSLTHLKQFLQLTGNHNA